MSMPASPGYQPPPQTAGATDVVTQLQGVVRQLGSQAVIETNGVTQLQAILVQLTAWVTAFTGRTTFGSFILAAAATTVVTEPAVQANSFIQLTALNAAAGTLMGSAKYLYISAKTPGASFTVATADGTNAAGTEQFSYYITTPA